MPTLQSKCDHKAFRSRLGSQPTFLSRHQISPIAPVHSTDVQHRLQQHAGDRDIYFAHPWWSSWPFTWLASNGCDSPHSEQKYPTVSSPNYTSPRVHNTHSKPALYSLCQGTGSKTTNTNILTASKWSLNSYCNCELRLEQNSALPISAWEEILNTSSPKAGRTFLLTTGTGHPNKGAQSRRNMMAKPGYGRQRAKESRAVAAPRFH